MLSDKERPVKSGLRSPSFILFLVYAIVSLSLLLISTRSFVVNLQEVGMSVFSGARSALFSVGDLGKKTIGSVKELSNLRREYAELTKRLEQYETLQRDSAEIKKENQRLKEQLGFSTAVPYQHFAARIIGRDSDNLFSAFVIDKGSNQGIKKDMCVIAFQDGMQGLVGKVIQVGGSESLVMPIMDDHSFVSSRLSDSRYEGIVSGQGSADRPLIMKYVRKRAKDEIKFGDMITTSGIGGVYPKEIVIGRVSKVLSLEYETSLSLELEPVIDFSRLEYVFAIDKGSGND